jgi:glycosyltransferase involved in cell wall biosynthesis
MGKKIPIIVGSVGSVSGVASWTFRLKEAFKEHDRYEILLFKAPGTRWDRRFDLSAPNAVAAFRLLDNLAPAVVIPNFIWTLFPIGLNKNIRCIGICHADSENEYYGPLRWYDPLIAKFIAVSPECSQKLAGYLPNRVDDITTLVYGVSVPEALERSYRVDPIRLVYGGRVVQQQKRVFDFVALAEHLLELQVDFVFDIVGDGSDLPALKEAMSKIAHAGRVRFLGRRRPEEMSSIWLKHDVFVQVSEFEGTSVSMLEAMAQGAVPVITATHSGAASVITQAKNGFLLPIGDMRAMAQIIAELAGSPDLLQTVGQTAYHEVKRFSMQAYVETFSTIIEQALASPPGKWPYERCLMPPSSVPMSLLSLPFEVQQDFINYLSGEDLAERISIHKLIEAIGFKLGNQLSPSWRSRFRGLGKRVLGS